MVERLHAEMAKRAIADAIEAIGSSALLRRYRWTTASLS